MNFAIDKFPPERLGLVTGSSCSVMFPLKGDGVIGMTTYARALAYQKFFKFYDEISLWQTEHGDMAEHFAKEHYRKYIGEIEDGKFYHKGDCGGSTDAETSDEVIDFKCPTTLKKWLDYLFIPLIKLDKSYIDQLQMYMYLTGKSKAKICAYLIETQFMTDNGLTYPIEEQHRMITVDVKKDINWESKLNEQLEFVVGLRDKFIDKLNKQFGNDNS